MRPLLLLLLTGFSNSEAFITYRFEAKSNKQYCSSSLLGAQMLEQNTQGLVLGTTCAMWRLCISKTGLREATTSGAQPKAKRKTGPAEANQISYFSWGYRKTIPQVPGIALVRNFSLKGGEILPFLNSKQGGDAQFVLLRKQRK